MPSPIEWQMWRQLRGAFKIRRMVFVPVLEEMKNFHVEQYETMEEALTNCPGPKTFLEPKGDKVLSDMGNTIDDHDLILVLGDTAQDNLSHVTSEDHAVRISTPQRTHLYGISAAAIALAYWVGQ